MNEKCKRSRILRATQQLIALNGFHGTSISMITACANVAAGTTYRYFEDKEALIREAFQDLEERVSTSIQQKHLAGRTLRERFLHIGKRFVHHYLTYPTDFRFTEQFYNCPYGVAHRRDNVLAVNGDNALRNLFEEARGCHLIKELPDSVLFALAFGPLIDVIRDHILGFICLDDELTDGIVDACWDAIKVQGQ
ncbi:MAG: TetR/AcrR family transcriptional regulator [Trichloromonadaceae bacterium]